MCELPPPWKWAFSADAADHGDVLLTFERQQAVVLEQHHAFGGDLVRQFVMRVHIEGSGFGRLFGFEDNAQDAAHRFVQHGFIQFAGADGFHDSLDAPILRTGHFPIQAAFQGGHPVTHRAPVRDNQSLEAPFVFENFGQQVVMFGGECAVELVVGAHHRPGLGLFDCFFKGGQVDFAQGALIHFGADAEALEFLVVGGIMLERSAHALALNAVDDAGSHFPGQVRVFGKILEVAAAQRGAFHVGAGAEQNIHVQGDAFLGQASPILWIKSTSQVEARQEAVGKQVAGKLSIAIELTSGTRRTPCGPSDTIISGTPRRSIGVVVHGLAPVHRAAFSSRVICEIMDWMFFIVVSPSLI